MGFKIGKLGILKGLGDQFLAEQLANRKARETIAAEERAVEAQIKAEQRAVTIQIEAEKRAVKTQKDAEERENKVAAKAAQLAYNREVYADSLTAEQEAVDSQNLAQLQSSLRTIEDQEKQKDAEKRKAEQQKTDIVNTFGLRFDSDESAGRLPTTDEMVSAIMVNVRLGKPVIIPTSLNVLGLDEAYQAQLELQKNQKTQKTVSILGGTGGLDTENPLALFNINDKTIPIYRMGEAGMGNVQERTNTNFVSYYRQLDNEGILDQAYREWIAGDRAKGSTFDKVKGIFNTLSKKYMKEAVLVSKNTSTGDVVITDPFKLINLDRIADGNMRQWFATEVLADMFGISEAVAKQLTGTPARVPIERDELRRLLLTDKSTYEWALEPRAGDDGAPKIVDSIYESFVEMSKYSGVGLVPLFETYKVFGGDAQTVMAQKQSNRSLFQKAVVTSPTGAVSFTANGKTTIRKLLDDKGLVKPSEQFGFIRAHLQSTGQARIPSRIKISGDGTSSLIYDDNRSTLYRVDETEARQQADAAREVVQITKQMLLLQEELKGGDVGVTRTVIKSVGALAELGKRLKQLTAKLVGENEQTDSLIRASGERLSKLFDFSDNLESTIQTQALFDILGEQLAFAMAAVFQKGEGGRAISDKDVEAQRNNLGLRGALATRTGVRQNLTYLMNEFGRIAEIKEKFATATGPLDFKAAYILDQVGPSSKVFRNYANMEQNRGNIQVITSDIVEERGSQGSPNEGQLFGVGTDGTRFPLTYNNATVAE